LSQLVVNPTRVRGLDKPHILDFVITDDPAALDNIELLSNKSIGGKATMRF